jgi:hypothetical protein
VLLSARAYILMDTLRKEGLANTELINAQVGTIQLKLLKIGARVVHSLQRIVIHLARDYLFKDIFIHVLSRLFAWLSHCQGRADGIQIPFYVCGA